MFLRSSLFFLLISPAIALAEDTPYILHNKEDISLALTINSKIDSLAKKISSCTSNKETLESCRCKASAELDELRALVSNALKLHPDWTGRTLNIVNGTRTVGVNMGALKSSIVDKPNCPS